MSNNVCNYKFNNKGLPILYKIKSNIFMEDMRCVANNKINYTLINNKISPNKSIISLLFSEEKKYIDKMEKSGKFIVLNNQNSLIIINKNIKKSLIYDIIFFIMGMNLKYSKKLNIYLINTISLLLKGMKLSHIINFLTMIYIRNYKYPKKVLYKLTEESKDVNGLINSKKLHMKKYNYLEANGRKITKLRKKVCDDIIPQAKKFIKDMPKKYSKDYEKIKRNYNLIYR